MTGSSSYTFKIEVPRQIHWNQAEGLRSFSREDFYAFLWELFDGSILGVHEGTLLTEDALASGVESQAWTVDSGEAPRGRDWIEAQVSETAVLYFSDEAGARAAKSRIVDASGLVCGEIEEQKAEDWDAAWKASFQGVSVPPYWEILPPWRESPDDSDSKVIRINPGAGFGTGTHETTQLCLQAVAFALRDAEPRTRVLDFGSGSGILAIAAARLGADVDGVEIDPMAVDNARENLELNDVEGVVRFAHTFAELEQATGTSHPKYAVVIANILRPVLVEFAETLVGKLKRPGGKVVLSGLIATDLPEVITRYSSLLGGARPEIFERGEWRALVFQTE